MPGQGIVPRVQTEAQRLLNEREAAAFLNLTARALQNWRYLGRGPRFVRISRKAIRYRLCDLQAFVEEHLRSSTSDPGQRER
jgi:hypothetical protein